MNKVSCIISVSVMAICALFTGAVALAQDAGRATTPPLTDFVSFAGMNHKGHQLAFSDASPLLKLTDGRQMEAASTFSHDRRNIAAFHAAFTYQAAKLANGGGDGVAPSFENIQRVAVAEENSRLAFAHDHLRTNTEITDAFFGEAVYDLIVHFVRVFNDVKNSSHVFSPFGE